MSGTAVRIIGTETHGWLLAESSFSEGTAGKVQQALNDRGYEAGPVDGVPGPKTRSAISAFQKDSGLPETGKIDEPLLGNLGLK